MPTVVLTGSIRERAGGVGTFQVDAETAGAAVTALEAHCPALRGWVIDERGALRRHVKLYIGAAMVPLNAPLGPDDELHVVAAISGG
jgi:molybdopterin converting factor small subunit